MTLTESEVCLPQTWLDICPVMRQILHERGYPRDIAPLADGIVLKDIHRRALQKLHKNAIRNGELKYTYWARLLWNEVLFPEKADDDNAEYQNFVTTLLFLLRRMDINRCVYPDVLTHLPKLIETYGADVSEVLLWSAGDEESYGQVARVLRSGLPAKINQITNINPKIQEKFKFFVHSRKEVALKSYVQSLVQGASDNKPLKLVVIEDSLRVLEAVQEFVIEYTARGVLIYIPILAGYGAKSSPGARDSSITLPHYCDGIVTLGSFEELLNREKFASIFKDAVIACDFDGVLTNNSNTQSGTGWLRAQAALRAMVSAYTKDQHCDESTASQYILAQLEKIAIAA